MTDLVTAAAGGAVKAAFGGLITKVLLGLVAAGILVGGFFYVRAVRAEAKLAEYRAEIAEANQEAEKNNASIVNELVRKELERERIKAPKVQQIIREVYRERPQLPAECDAALDPLRDAVDGLRKIRSPR